MTLPALQPTRTLLNTPEPPKNGGGGKWGEEGALGLEAYSGFITKAYNAELRWPAAYPIYNRLRRADPEMTIIRQIYASVCAGVVMEWQPPKEKPTPDEVAAADFFNSVMSDIAGGTAELAQTYIAHVPFMGFGLWEIVPGLRKTGWRPPQDDPWRSKFDDGLIGIRRLAWRDHSSFARWELNDQTGRALGFWQVAPPRPEVFLPAERLLHVTWGDPNNPEGLAGLEPVYRLERIKFGLEVVQGIGYEHSAGHLSVTVEDGDLTNLKATIQAAAKAILTAQPGNYAAWPKGTKGELIDTPFGSAPSILETIRYYGILKMAVYNMQHIAMATLSGSGSYAAVSDSSAMWLVSFNAMLSDFARQVDETLGRWLFDRNRLAFAADTRRPTFVARPLDKIVPLAELGSFATAWKAIEGFGPDDLLALRRRTGFLPEVLAADQGGEVVAPDPVGGTEGEADDQVGGDPAEESADDLAAEDGAEKSLTLGRRRLVRLSADWRYLAESYSAISTRYWTDVRGAVSDYLAAGKTVTAYRNNHKAVMAEAFDAAYTAAYEQGGGEDIDADDAKWLESRISRERDFIDGLYSTLKAWRESVIADSGKLTGKDIDAKAQEVADHYVDGLDAVFSEGRLRGARNVMLTFRGKDGAKPCATCSGLMGLRRSAKWWVGKGLIPGAGNSNFECQGYNCQHLLRDDKGRRWTL